MEKGVECIDMKFLKENWSKVLIVVLIAGLFYWYEWRPTKIKENCSSEARFDMRAIGESDDIKRQEFINMYYNDCLMRFGLK